jgi:hypothetical protein
MKIFLTEKSFEKAYPKLYNYNIKYHEFLIVCLKITS